MRTAASLAALICMGVVGAWSTDSIVDGAPLYFTAAAAAGSDATLELKWDNGTRRWSWAWYTGGDHWAGNDFDLSTLSAYRAIEKVKLYTCGTWPNVGWDGVRVAIYNFSTVPGSMLWPTAGGGYFFKPSAGIQAHIWVECDINWTCPSAKFLAAEEQFYNHPNCDPYAVDNNTVFMRHSWHYSQGSWEPASYSPPYDPYRNIMIRVFVDDETVSVSPTSVGRVKALYY
jgi:hypothetical protein